MAPGPGIWFSPSKPHAPHPPVKKKCTLIYTLLLNNLFAAPDNILRLKGHGTEIFYLSFLKNSSKPCHALLRGSESFRSFLTSS
jgi:hypothetical protein